MNTISLEARKRMIAENLPMVDDSSVIEQIEIILKNFTPSVKRFTIEELEERALKSEKAIKKGQLYTINEVRNKLGL
ncbi:MAG: hypothetical protein GX371_09425 [Bacteroidales bacterium]|nr:hypothetical protein [Bacteroidales bacterium]